MKVLFITVNAENSDNCMKIYEERDIRYLATILKDNGHKTMISKKDNQDNVLDLCFKEWETFGPDVICLPMNTHKRVIEWIKDYGAETIIIRGTGSISTLTSGIDILKRESYIDYVLAAGEVYNSWVDLMKCIENKNSVEKVPGLIYRINNEVKINQTRPVFDINSFSISDTESLQDKAYITTSLGCIGNCSFCCEKELHGKWQGRDIESVLSEIKYHSDNGIRHFHFSDACIEAPDIKLKRLSNLCEGILSLNRIILYQANFRPDFSMKVTPGIMELLINSGLYKAFIGVESGSQEDLNIFNKRCTVQQAKETIKLFESYNVHTEIGFIMFQPYSSIESLMQNVDILEELGKTTFRHIKSRYTGRVGRRLSNIANKEGLFEPNGAYRFKDSRVMPLWQFISAYFNNYKEIVDRYDEAMSYHSWYLYFLNLYHKQGRLDLNEPLLSYLNKSYIIQKSISIHVSNWFRQLIEVAREGFTLEKASEITCNTMPETFIFENAKYLERENEKLKNQMKDLTSNK